MSSNIYGAGLSQPSVQTILPVITESGRIMGFYPIAKTTFAGTETSFTLASHPSVPVPITSVQLPPKNAQNVNSEQRVEEYMAAMWPANQDGLKPWIGYSELVSANDPQYLGYYSRWSMPVVHIMHRFAYGAYLEGLFVNMNQTVSVPSTPTPATPQNATISWATSQPVAAFQQECAYLDFNWVNLFQTNNVVTSQAGGTQVIPVSITVTSNPAGGVFKASALQGIGMTQVPGGAVQFNTIRILRLAQPTAGSYTFTFNVTANVNGAVQTYPVTLTLTVA